MGTPILGRKGSFYHFILTLIGKSGRFTTYFAPHDTNWLSPLHWSVTCAYSMVPSQVFLDMSKVICSLCSDEECDNSERTNWYSNGCRPSWLMKEARDPLRASGSDAADVSVFFSCNNRHILQFLSSENGKWRRRCWGRFLSSVYLPRKFLPRQNLLPAFIFLSGLNTSSGQVNGTEEMASVVSSSSVAIFLW